MYLLIITNLLFSLTYILIEIALKYTTPLVINTIRMAIAGFLTIVFQFFFHRKDLIIKLNDIIYFFNTCLMHMCINFLSETYALQYLSSLSTSMIYLLTPIFSSVIDYLLNNNKLTYQQVILVIIGTILSFLMIFINSSEKHLDTNIFSYFLLLISIGSSTLAWYRIKRLINKGYSLITINGYSALIASFFSLSVIILTYHTNELSSLFSINKITFISILSLAIIGNIIGYSLYDILLKKYTITTIFLADTTVPCITACYNFIFFNKVLKKNYILFFALFVFSMRLFNYYEKKKQLL